MRWNNKSMQAREKCISKRDTDIPFIHIKSEKYIPPGGLL